MRLVVDVCLSPDWVAVLAAAGHDVIHWLTVGPANATDHEIMAWALVDDRIVFTHDLDFGNILAASASHGPSVVQLREQDVDPDRIGTQVIRALDQCAPQLEAGAIVTIDIRRLRARLLPLVRRSAD
jgi:predicted nuclease of predicted toxin-antitoxin system